MGGWPHKVKPYGPVCLGSSSSNTHCFQSLQTWRSIPQMLRWVQDSRELFAPLSHTFLVLHSHITSLGSHTPSGAWYSTSPTPTPTCWPVCGSHTLLWFPRLWGSPQRYKIQQALSQSPPNPHKFLQLHWLPRFGDGM